MRLTRIHLTGYSRFRDATCKVDGPIIAFVGPNEAGKSSLLRALQWLTDPRGRSLPQATRNREQPIEDYDTAVRAVFALDESEMTLIKSLGLDTEADLEGWVGVHLSLARQADGNLTQSLVPALHRNLQAVRDAEVAASSQRSGEGEFDARTSQMFDELVEILDSTNINWNERRAARLQAKTQELEAYFQEEFASHPEGEGEPEGWAIRGVLDALAPAVTAVMGREPGEVALERLEPFVPRFVMFRDEDRGLPASYNVASNDGNHPPALINLLSVAATSVEEIAASVARGASARLTTMRAINASLSVVADFWSQNRADGQRLVPHITINESGVIDIGVDDVEGVIAINERSDGLQTYLALISFLLAVHDLDTPKILLIDEAERNLHYDAQGDLVRLLTNDLPVAQVLYSTHSPGCLPLDLGTGIRVVSRSAEDPKESVLSDRFWTDRQPGFSRLLLMMGAEAAAFSALNAALVTEGPSEMILLPHILRKADPTRKIDFQVSFGLSNMSIPRDLGEIAIKTTFLVDGDEAGRRKLRQLEKAGVPESNRLQLPEGKAIEDLIDRTAYLDAVDKVIEESPGTSVLVDRNALRADVTIAKAVDLLEKGRRGFRAPSHSDVALYLANRPAELKLATDAADYVRTVLFPSIAAAFSSAYEIKPATD